jgi:hypothetical protein
MDLPCKSIKASLSKSKVDGRCFCYTMVRAHPGHISNFRYFIVNHPSIYIVAYRLVARWSPPRPLLCNGTVKTLLQQQRVCVFCVVCAEEFFKIIGATVKLRIQLWSVNQRTTEAEESPLLRFFTRKRLVKTLQRNSHC